MPLALWGLIWAKISSNPSSKNKPSELKNKAPEWVLRCLILGYFGLNKGGEWASSHA